VDDLRIGRIARALRQRLHLRQADLARAASCSQSEYSNLERGRIDGMSVRQLRRLFRALDAEVVITMRWRGGMVDQVLDARHAGLAEVMTRLLEASGWEVVPEVTYSVYGERGSIDLLAWHAPSRCLLVIELKTELTSIEETLRRHDVKVRLAADIARQRFGWNVGSVGRLLVMPEDRTARRRVELHRSVMRGVYPAGNVDVRRWLRTPSGNIGGVLFLTGIAASRTKRRIRRSTP
jgi:transcriptional regulator with XRE-family HTH domain